MASQRSLSPYINRFLSADTIIPSIGNPQSWNRYSYVLNNPIRFRDPSGHRCVSDDGYDSCSHKDIVLGNIAYKFGKDVKIRNEKEWRLSELMVLYNTLNKVLNTFDNNKKAFHNAFGQLTFEMLSDWKANVVFDRTQMGESDYDSGLIQFRHGAFTWSAGYYGAAGWSIAHEMGHVFDFKGATGNPQAYFSNLFVDVFDQGGCYLGPNGCLGDQPSTGYKLQNWGLGIGDYQPSGRSTPYGLHVSSTEDFAESFAANVFNGTGNSWAVDDNRKNIIQIDIAVMVSYSQ